MNKNLNNELVQMNYNNNNIDNSNTIYDNMRKLI